VQVTLYTLTAVFASVPQPVLAAVILVALRNQLLQHRDLVTLWRVSKYVGIASFRENTLFLMVVVQESSQYVM
jgi:MFS superfamily sulfate permease-like transporter